MKYAKLLAMGCAVALATVGMTGCTKTTADSTQTFEAEESESVTAQVTAVDGNTVTADDIKEGSDASNGMAATTIDSDTTADGETYSFTGSTDNVIANGYHLYVDGEQVL